MRPETFAQRLFVMADALPKDMLDAVRDESRLAEERMRRHFVPYTRGARPAGKLFSRSGRARFALRHNITQSQVSAEGTETRVRFTYDRSDYQVNRAMAVQEFGMANIRPKWGQKLAIPGHAQRDARGVPKFGSARGARAFYTLFRRGSKLLGFPKTGGPVRHQFSLRDSVSVPARPVVTPEVYEAGERLAARLTGAFAERI